MDEIAKLREELKQAEEYAARSWHTMEKLQEDNELQKGIANHERERADELRQQVSELKEKLLRVTGAHSGVELIYQKQEGRHRGLEIVVTIDEKCILLADTHDKRYDLLRSVLNQIENKLLNSELNPDNADWLKAYNTLARAAGVPQISTSSTNSSRSLAEQEKFYQQQKNQQHANDKALMAAAQQFGNGNNHTERTPVTEEQRERVNEIVKKATRRTSKRRRKRGRAN